MLPALIATGWTLIAIPIAVLIGRGIRHADQQQAQPLGVN